jgi:hypothetical protein
VFADWTSEAKNFCSACDRNNVLCQLEHKKKSSVYIKIWWIYIPAVLDLAKEHSWSKLEPEAKPSVSQLNRHFEWIVCQP